MVVKADHQVLVVITHSKLCKLHHTQIHHGGNGIKCNFPTSEVKISTSFFLQCTDIDLLLDLILLCITTAVSNTIIQTMH